MKNFVVRKIRKKINKYRKRKAINKLKKNYRRATGKVVFVLQTPIHTNIGDHAIAQAQINFINKRFPKCILIEVNQSFLNEFCDEFKKIIRPDDIITLIGGGKDRKSTRLNSSHVAISYAVFCLKKTMR